MALQTQMLGGRAFTNQSDTSLVWLGMAGLMVNVRGAVMLVDPLLTVLRDKSGGEVSETGHRFRVPLPIEAKDVPRVDAVLYTHEDGDHYARPTAMTLERNCRPRFYATSPVGASLARDVGVPAERLTVVTDEDRFSVGETTVRVTPALHDYPRPQGPIQRGEAVGFRIETPDGVIWIPGDTRLIPELERERDVDVMLFDVAEVDAHLGPAGSTRLALTSGAKVLVAYHYGTYEMPLGEWGNCDPEAARPHVERAGIAVRLRYVNLGEEVRLPIRKASDVDSRRG